MLAIQSPFREECRQTLEVIADMEIAPPLVWRKSLSIDLGEKQSLVIRRIDKGTYTVGSKPNEAGRQLSDLDAHPVVLNDAYFVAETETTQGQYATLMHLADSQVESQEVNPSRSRARHNPDLPVERVSYNDLMARRGFFERLNEKLKEQGIPFLADLPDEDEWEIACRAGTTSSYNDGSNLTTSGTDKALEPLAHYNWANSGEPIPVRSRKPNAWGLYDMLGNVAELTRRSPEKNENPSAVKGEPPVRVCIRGGSWKSAAENTRSASRIEVYAERRDPDTGFRVVLRPRPSGS
jgi:formylglycine-generating enzyme required for sulfatase activity